MSDITQARDRFAKITAHILALKLEGNMGQGYTITPALLDKARELLEGIGNHLVTQQLSCLDSVVRAVMTKAHNTLKNDVAHHKAMIAERLPGINLGKEAEQLRRKVYWLKGLGRINQTGLVRVVHGVCESANPNSAVCTPGSS